MTIQCTNTNCLTNVVLPEDSTYVACPNCNTWLFLSDLKVSPEAAHPSATPSNHDLLPTIESPGSSPFSLYDPNSLFPENGVPLPAVIQSQKPSGEPAVVGLLVHLDGRQWPLKVGKNTIGRSSGNVVIPNSTISRQHCIIEVTPRPAGGGWDYLIYDIGHETGTASTNGIFISGRTLRLQNYERIPLSNGMGIQLGNVQIYLDCSSD